MKLKYNKSYFYLSPFSRLKLFKCGKIDKIFDNNILKCQKLSKELNDLSSVNISSVNETKIDENNANNNNINKKIKIINNINKLIKKRAKGKNSLSQNNILFSLDDKDIEDNNKKILKLKNSTIFSSRESSLPILNKNKKFIFNKELLSNSNKRKKINIIHIKNKILNNSNNNYFSQNSDSLTNNFGKYYSSSNSLENNSNNKRVKNFFSFNKNFKFRTNSKLKTFITQQITKKNMKKDKIKIKNLKKVIKINDHKKELLQKISKKVLTNFINTSITLYDDEINKLKSNNDSLNSGRQNFYNIKNLLKKFDISQNISKELDYEINEDIDVKKIYKTMKYFKQSLKDKVIVNKNDVTKNVLITKTNADIINYCDYFTKMDNLYFYKNNKIYTQNYPILSKKAREDPFNKDYKKIIYRSNKKIIEDNAVDIRRLFKSCSTVLNKINDLYLKNY